MFKPSCAKYAASHMEPIISVKLFCEVSYPPVVGQASQSGCFHLGQCTLYIYRNLAVKILASLAITEQPKALLPVRAKRFQFSYAAFREAFLALKHIVD